MINISQSHLNGFSMPAVAEIRSESIASRSIRSFYLMAKAIVSKVDEIERDRKKLILVVDDEPLTVQLIDEFLQEGNLDCKILSASNGRMAYDIATSVIPDLVIADWVIPEWDGVELIKRLKENPATRNVPVILATGVLAKHDEFEKILQSGAIDYMRKPLDYAELISRIKTVLVLGETLKELEQQKGTAQLNSQFVNFLLDVAPNPIFYQDKWGHVMGCNKHFEKLMGRAKEEFVGRALDEFLPEAVAHIMEYHFASLKMIGAVRKFEIEIPQEEHHKHMVVSYVGFGSSSLEIVIGSLTDITEIVQSGRDAVAQLDSDRKQEKEELKSNVEKLQAELSLKHRELEKHLELLIHSRNGKEKLIDSITKLQPYLNMEGESKLRLLLKQLQWELKEESGLSVEKKFDEVNGELYNALTKICPDITRNEKRLCAYLRMNHGPADIAKITLRSLNSINVGLARLRAKLNLPNTKDLRTYLIELSPPNSA